MYLAYDLLSDTMKSLLDPLVAVHDGAIPYLGNYKVAPADGTKYPKNEHPVITTHPETGKKILYVNSGFTSHIKGMHAWESRALLQGLYSHIAQTQRLYCHVEWQPNTLTFWDNRCTQHHAVWDYFPHSRYGERVSILGTVRPAA
jgi:taurine dioxygenase